MAIKKMLANNDVHGVTFDPWRSRRLLAEMEALGVDTHGGEGSGLLAVAHPQSFVAGQKAFDEGKGLNICRSTEICQELIINGRLTVKRNPLLSWAVSNTTIIFDGQENGRPQKAKSTGRIDPVVALIMATGAAWYKPKGSKDAGKLQWVVDHLRDERARAWREEMADLPTGSLENEAEQSPFFGAMDL